MISRSRLASCAMNLFNEQPPLRDILLGNLIENGRQPARAGGGEHLYESADRRLQQEEHWGSFLFVPFFVYLWLAVEPRLIFHGAGVITNFPSFYTTRQFLVEHLSYPGGPVEYLAAFLSQLFYYSWLGAIVVGVQAWLLYLCVAHMLRSAGLI